MQKTIGRRIAELRRRHGLTQEELAEQLNVSPQAVSKWENDLCCPDILLLPGLAQRLRVDADELLTGEASGPRTPEDGAMEKRVLRIRIEEEGQEEACTEVPMTILQAALDDPSADKQISIHREGMDVAVDLVKVMQLVCNGFTGKMLEIVGDGSKLEIWVE